MPSIDLAAIPSVLARPLVVAIVHVPILLVALFAAPLWIIAAMRPQSHGEMAIRLLNVLRGWSKDAVGSVGPGRAR